MPRSSLFGGRVTPALLLALLAGFVVPAAGQTVRGGDDGEPPLPSAKKKYVRVASPTAEVRSGDDLVAEVRRGQRLEVLGKKGAFYLVVVDGKKGWLRVEDAAEATTPARADGRRTGPRGSSNGKATSPDGSLSVVARDGNLLAYRDGRLVWQRTLGWDPLPAPLLCFRTKKGVQPNLYVATGTSLYALEPGTGKFYWSVKLGQGGWEDPSLTYDAHADQVVLRRNGVETRFRATTGWKVSEARVSRPDTTGGKETNATGGNPSGGGEANVPADVAAFRAAARAGGLSDADINALLANRGPASCKDLTDFLNDQVKDGRRGADLKRDLETFIRVFKEKVRQ